MGLESVDLTNQNQVIAATWKVRLKTISTLVKLYKDGISAEPSRAGYKTEFSQCLTKLCFKSFTVWLTLLSKRQLL